MLLRLECTLQFTMVLFFSDGLNSKRVRSRRKLSLIYSNITGFCMPNTVSCEVASPEKKTSTTPNFIYPDIKNLFCFTIYLCRINMCLRACIDCRLQLTFDYRSHSRISCSDTTLIICNNIHFLFFQMK